MTSVYKSLLLIIGIASGSSLSGNNSKNSPSPHCLYVATYNGGMSISGNNGDTWTQSTTDNGLPSNIVRSLFVLENTIYAGTEGGLATSEDKGKKWKQVISLDPSSIDAITVPIPSRIYVGGDKLGLQISDDSGKTWTKITLAQGLSDGYITSVFALANGMVYVGTSNGLSISNDD